MYIVTVDTDKCTGCQQCVESCPAQVFFEENGKAAVDEAAECLGCMTCVTVCESGAVKVMEV